MLGTVEGDFVEGHFQVRFDVGLCGFLYDLRFSY